jgi:DHA1 family bicyclomycin/chloramphenicol resistance-like MFS transporter
MRFGMRSLSNWSLLALIGLSTTFLGVSYFLAGNPPLAALMIFFMLAFFCIGLLNGNLNSIAMEPLGHIAGMGAAVVGSLSTFIQVPLGTLIGQSYNGTILPLVGGFAVLSMIAMVVLRWAEGGEKEDVYVSP